jgi:hypothetical protein
VNLREASQRDTDKLENPKGKYNRLQIRRNTDKRDALRDHCTIKHFVQAKVYDRDGRELGEFSRGDMCVVWSCLCFARA